MPTKKTHIHFEYLRRILFLYLTSGLGPVSAQHGTVGRPCEVSTDCGTGNYCAGNKRCACLTTYVEIDSYCWRSKCSYFAKVFDNLSTANLENEADEHCGCLEINPGESGCTQNRQCEAVWPGAYCRSGECRCANNQPPFRTRDGLVCLNYGFCPLNGNNPKFRIENQVSFLDSRAKPTLNCRFNNATAERTPPAKLSERLRMTASAIATTAP